MKSENKNIGINAKLGKIVLMALFSLIALSPAIWAADTDSIQLFVVPVQEYGVIVDTETFNFGTVDMNSSTRTVNPMPVTSTGTTSPIEYEISAAVTSVGGTWSLATTDEPSENTAVLFAKFNSVDPDQTANDYGANDIVDSTPQDVGDGDPGYFEGDQQMDDMPLLCGTSLWFKIKTPTTTTTVDQQTITVTITAEIAD